MRLFRCRRGSVAVMFGLGLAILIGFVGFGSEAGQWYVTKRHGQNAADLAAMAGAIALASGGNAIATGTSFATKNGYTNGATPTANVSQTVQVSTGSYAPPVFTSGGTPMNAVKVIVSQSEPRLFSALFVSGVIDIQDQAVAAINNPARVCFLALATLTIGGNQAINADGCTLMSNGNVKLASPPTLNGVGSLDAVNGCGANASICSGATPQHDYYSLPANDPIGNLTSSFPTFSASNTVAFPSPVNGVLTLAQSATNQAYTGNLTIGGNGNGSASTVNLTGGTYYFSNAHIKMSSGALNGTGVNLVLLNGSTLDIQGGQVNLSASTTATPAALDGILIYDTQSGTVRINGNSSSTYGGALYLPNASVIWNGNAASAMHCTEVIASALTFSGTSTTSNFDTSGCPSNVVPTTQIVVLAQ